MRERSVLGNGGKNVFAGDRERFDLFRKLHQFPSFPVIESGALCQIRQRSLYRALEGEQV